MENPSAFFTSHSQRQGQTYTEQIRFSDRLRITSERPFSSITVLNVHNKRLGSYHQANLIGRFKMSWLVKLIGIPTTSGEENKPQRIILTTKKDQTSKINVMQRLLNRVNEYMLRNESVY